MKAYLDTNVFLLALDHPESSSSQIIVNALKGEFTCVISDYSIEEIILNIKRRYGKDTAGKIRQMIMSISQLEIVKIKELNLEEFKTLVADADDIPHIAACIHAMCDVFVTANRRLTGMKIKDRVTFKSPDEFLKEI